MAKPIPPPDDSRMVLSVMRKYVSEKGWYFTDQELDLMAEVCFLHFDALGWKGIKFWPSVVKKWVVNEMKYNRKQTPKPPPKEDVHQTNNNLKQKIEQMLERKRGTDYHESTR